MPGDDMEMEEGATGQTSKEGEIDYVPPEYLDELRSEQFEMNSGANESLEGAFSSVSQHSTKIKASQIPETTAIMREFLATRPKPSDFLPKQPDDEIQIFFNSMAATTRKFSPLSVARLKLKISQLVGEEEIAWAEDVARTQVIYVEAPGAPVTNPSVTNPDENNQS